MTVVLLSTLYTADRIKKAEIYYCYYEMPPNNPNLLEVRIIKPNCVNISLPQSNIPNCIYKGNTLITEIPE